MIVVFVVDTSPSMAAPCAKNDGSGGSTPVAARGISKLDFAKMSVENLARSMDKRIMENNRSVLLASAQMMAARKLAGNAAAQQSYDVGRLEQFDEFLLLSSSLQPDIDGTSSSSTPSLESIAEAAACGAGGRLLVGSIEDASMADNSGGTNHGGMMVPHPPDRSDFEHELKRLRTATLPPHDIKTGKKRIFPEWAGGAIGLSEALSHGLGLLSRYRLTRGRVVEHFGMGRLPWVEHQMTKLQKDDAANNAANANANSSPLQPACLVLLTDGECLRLPAEEGGGQLSLRFGNMPLREFYREPFRWDQRIIILHLGDASTPPLHKSLRALCEVTGGCYMRIDPSRSSLQNILKRISPPKPKQHTIPDPLRLPSMPTPAQLDETQFFQPNTTNLFINGGPICSFQCLEGGGQGMASLHRAMLLFAGSCEQQRWILSSSDAPPSTQPQLPIWPVPESHFPSKKLDTLPPRPSQPLLHYSRNFQAVGSQVFDPYFVMKALHHLDKLHVTIRQLLVSAGDNPPPIVNRMLQRDVYVCEWLGGHESAAKSAANEPTNSSGAPRTMAGREHFPVCCRGSGRPALSEGEDNILNIGILRVPHNWLKLNDTEVDANTNAPTKSDRLPSLTLLPPDAHILIPLLIKVAEMELRIIKKIDSKEQTAKAGGGATAGLIKKKVNSAAAARAIHLDDNWKADFRAYLFRLPPYYLPAIRRVLRPMLPPNVLPLLNFDSQETLPLICFSPACLMKIQNGEKAASGHNEWIRCMEQRMHRTRSMQEVQLAAENMGRNLSQQGGVDAEDRSFGYGQYDPRMTEHQYLNLLRTLPPPKSDQKEEAVTKTTEDESKSVVPSPTALLPLSCLLAYYESRRRWLFGGTGLTTRGLHVDGVNNDGTNVHRYNANQKPEDEPLLALAGLADTTSSQKISRMGDFKERLNFSPVTFVDYGNATGAAMTTASDGTPLYSVDDDVLPLNFFDGTTGEFVDSPQARARARLMINFGNPFHDKRGGTLIPEKYSDQRPPLQAYDENGPSTPPGSPPHDAYDSVSPIEGEGEAAFTGSRVSPPRGLSRKMLDSKLLVGQKRTMGAPPLGTKDNGKRMKPSAPEAKPQHLSPQPQRPPPPRRNSSNAPPPPPPPKPGQAAQKNTPQKPPAPKPPAPPRRQNSNEESLEKKQTPQKVGTSKPVPWQSSEKASAAPTTPQQQELKNPAVKPNIKMPDGWSIVWSKSQKRWYFYNMISQKSVWEYDKIK